MTLTDDSAADVAQGRARQRARPQTKGARPCTCAAGTSAASSDHGAGHGAGIHIDVCKGPYRPDAQHRRDRAGVTSCTTR